MGFPGGTVFKKYPPANAGDTGHSVRSPGQEDPLEEEMATYSYISFLGASWATVHGVTKSWTRLSPHTVDKGFPGSASGQEPACRWGRQKRRWFYLWVGKIPWSRKWQPTPVFLPGESPWTEEPSFFSPLTWLKWLNFTCTGNSAFGTPQTGRGLCAWGWGWSWGC